jgi:hypothetical protein
MDIASIIISFLGLIVGYYGITITLSINKRTKELENQIKLLSDKVHFEQDFRNALVDFTSYQVSLSEDNYPIEKLISPLYTNLVRLIGYEDNYKKELSEHIKLMILVVEEKEYAKLRILIDKLVGLMNNTRNLIEEVR